MDVRRLALLVFIATACSCTPGARAQDSDDMWPIFIRDAFDVPQRPPALDAKRWSTFSPMAGVLADRVTYATADGMLVPAIVYRPDPKTAPFKGKLPGIVVVNGHGGDKFSWYAFYSGMMFARAGAVVVTYDPIGEGERNTHKLSRESPSPHDVYPPTPAGMTDDAWHMEWGPHVAGLMQADLMQAVSYLDAQPDVDSKRIGVVGYSMGAFVAGIAGAIDRRIHAIILSGGGTYDDGTGYFDASKLPCQGPPYRALLPRLGDNGRGYDIFFLNAERGPMLVMNGAADTVMDIPHHNTEWFDAMRSRLIANCASYKFECKNVFTHIEYPGISHRTSWVNRDGLRWLNDQLHFAFWNTNAKIDAQGTMHISTWINANHVDISKNYLREDREGGLDAVGSGLPGISRSDLMVLPDADWERLKGQLTFEAWETKTLATLSSSAPSHVN